MKPSKKSGIQARNDLSSNQVTNNKLFHGATTTTATTSATYTQLLHTPRTPLYHFIHVSSVPYIQAYDTYAEFQNARHTAQSWELFDHEARVVGPEATHC